MKCSTWMESHTSPPPRPGRRGGGSAITCDDEQFYIKEIKVANPDNLEVTFATMRPKSEHAPSFTIILCALYSPPRSRKKSKLIDHISQTYHELKMKYPSAFFLLSGDVNQRWKKGWKLGRNFPESKLVGRKFSAIERCFDLI